MSVEAISKKLGHMVSSESSEYWKRYATMPQSNGTNNTNTNLNNSEHAYPTKGLHLTPTALIALVVHCVLVNDGFLPQRWFKDRKDLLNNNNNNNNNNNSNNNNNNSNNHNHNNHNVEVYDSIIAHEEIKKWLAYPPDWCVLTNLNPAYTLIYITPNSTSTFELQVSYFQTRIFVK